MLKTVYFNARFIDIGWMPVKKNTYRTDVKKAIADYIKCMEEIGVIVIETSDAHFA